MLEWRGIRIEDRQTMEEDFSSEKSWRWKDPFPPPSNWPVNLTWNSNIDLDRFSMDWRENSSKNPRRRKQPRSIWQDQMGQKFVSACVDCGRRMLIYRRCRLIILEVVRSGLRCVSMSMAISHVLRERKLSRCRRFEFYGQKSLSSCFDHVTDQRWSSR